MPNEKQMRRAAHRHTKEKQNLEAEGLRKLAESYEGRTFLWWLLGEAGVFSNPFTQNALHTAFNCGNMNFGQRLLARLVEEQPNLYLKMMQENAEREEKLAAKLEENEDDVY